LSRPWDDAREYGRCAVTGLLQRSLQPDGFLAQDGTDKNSSPFAIISSRAGIHGNVLDGTRRCASKRVSSKSARKSSVRSWLSHDPLASATNRKPHPSEMPRVRQAMRFLLLHFICFRSVS